MIKLSVKDCVLVYENAARLDGYSKVTKDDQVVIVPYKFSDATRTKLRRWCRAIKPHYEDFIEARNAIIIELSPETRGLVKGSKEYFNYEARVKALEQEEHTLTEDLRKLRLNGDLLADGANPIPDTILDALDSIIEDVDEKPEGK